MTEKALSHITILDFSHLLQGPFATQLLGDMGANVIKIERAGPGDLFRSMTFRNKWVGDGESPNFLAWNRNKRSIALNLKRRGAPDHHEDGGNGRCGGAELPPRRDGQAGLWLRGFQGGQSRASSIARAPAMARTAPMWTAPGRTC
jgi:hypothetical protein